MSTFVVPDALYYRLVAAQNAVTAAEFAAELADVRLQQAEAEKHRIMNLLLSEVTENGKYTVGGEFTLTETIREIQRIPVAE